MVSTHLNLKVQIFIKKWSETCKEKKRDSIDSWETEKNQSSKMRSMKRRSTISCLKKNLNWRRFRKDSSVKWRNKNKSSWKWIIRERLRRKWLRNKWKFCMKIPTSNITVILRKLGKRRKRNRREKGNNVN